MDIQSIGDCFKISAGGGGKMLTQSFPTNFHSFHSSVMAPTTEDAEKWREVTASQRASIEKTDAAYAPPPEWLVDQFKAMGGVFNRDTGFGEMNGITDLSADDMREIVNISPHILNAQSRHAKQAFYLSHIRTLKGLFFNPMGGNIDATEMFAFSQKLEVLRLNEGRRLEPYFSGIANAEKMFRACVRLRELTGLVLMGTVSSLRDALETCPKLERLEIHCLNRDLDLSGCPQLSGDSLQVIVSERYEKGKHSLSSSAETNPFSVTLHPDVFAKIPEDLFELAAEKQITLTT